jgi:hypothetical protein
MENGIIPFHLKKKVEQVIYAQLLRTFSRKYTLTNPINLSTLAKRTATPFLTVEDANIHLKTDGNKNSRC